MTAPTNADVRTRLLPFTIDNAARIEFYRDLWRGIDVASVREPAQLPELPYVTKDRYRDAFMTAADPRAVDLISHSTGTTGALTYRYRSRLEAAVIDQLFTPAADAEPAVGIVLTNLLHGMPMPMPVSFVSIPAGTHTDLEVGQAVAMLQSAFPVRGTRVAPTRLGGSGIDVALIAQALFAHGVDPADLALTGITLTGPVDEGMRRFVARTFGVPVHERFSLSEIFGGATRSPGEDWFLSDPYVVTEVTDDDGAPVGDGGTGHLVMTELYPFVQVQPLVRYRTGDIVERVGEPEAGRVAFRWLGRSRQCARPTGAGAGTVVALRPLWDALGCLGLVARPRARPQLTTVACGDVGRPEVELTLVEPDTVEVRIGLVVDPRVCPQEAQTVVDRAWSVLRDMVDDGDAVRVSVVLAVDHPRRGSLAPQVGQNLEVVRLGPQALAGPPPAVPGRECAAPV